MRRKPTRQTLLVSMFVYSVGRKQDDLNEKISTRSMRTSNFCMLCKSSKFVEDDQCQIHLLMRILNGLRSCRLCQYSRL